MTTQSLRGGFTTGSAAAAATAAALRLMLDGVPPAHVSVAPPPGATVHDRLIISIAEAGRNADNEAWAAVIKDGGDDPDVTHKARIEAHIRFRPDPAGPLDPAPEVRLVPKGSAGEAAVNPGPCARIALTIDGGEGVGRVTLPGLPVAVGEAAINPGPRAQIALAVDELCARHALRGELTVCIRVPEGERLARHTLNARLGIVGGISILGTQGTSRPFSHEAWQSTVVQALDVAEALGCRCIGLSAGRRSERLLMAEYPDMPPQAFVQAADLIGFAVGQAARRSFEAVLWGCFFGKLLKLAQGQLFTHAREGMPDLAALACFCARHGLAADRVAAIGAANTAAQALDCMLDDPRARDIVRLLACRARDHLERHARQEARALPIVVRVFHFDGTELANSTENSLQTNGE